MDENVLRSEPGVHRWDGPKARVTLAGTAQGTLLLTDRHLIFLAVGGGALGRHVRSSDVGALLEAPRVDGAGGAADAHDAGDGPAVGGPGAYDLRALAHPASFAVPVDHLDEAWAARRLDRTAYLALRLRDLDGAGHEFAVMRPSGMPDAPGWARSIEVARTLAR